MLTKSQPKFSLISPTLCCHSGVNITPSPYPQYVSFAIPHPFPTTSTTSSHSSPSPPLSSPPPTYMNLPTTLQLLHYKVLLYPFTLSIL